MNKKKGCAATIIFLLVCAFAILGTGIIVYSYYPNWLDQKRGLASPPILIVDAPLDGDTASEGDILTASATASGPNPIAQVELWLDGELYRQQMRDLSLPQGLTTLSANFPVEMTEGAHMLYWRAIDSLGLVGQSSPITIYGAPRVGGSETTVVTTREGQNLQDVADETGVDPDVLANLNPGLGTGDLPGGTNVTAPIIPPQNTTWNQPPSDGGAPNQPQPPPDLPPGAMELLLSPIAINPIPAIIGLLDQLPAAPSLLRASWENCMVDLQWYDNATNEEYYTVWMQAGSNPPTNIATLGKRNDTGPARYTFKSPAFGIYRFWVEAGNFLGSQPSEVEWIFINDPTCQEAIATRLEIEALDLTYDGDGKFYCYVSLEGIPEKRIPEDDSDYIEIIRNQNGAEWNITEYWGGEKRILVPIPADGELALVGKCMLLMGTNAVELGEFSSSAPSSKWDGSRLEVRGPSYVIGYRVLPHGSQKAEGAYSYTDFNLPKPYGLSFETQTAQNITLKWKWSGNPQEISNFVIAMDDTKEIRWVNKSDRQASIVLPYACGKTHKFAVAAVTAEGARSEYSAWQEYTQLPCKMYADVTFDSFVITAMDDSEDGACDEAELVFSLFVQTAGQYSNRGNEWDCRCHETIRFRGAPTFRVPIDLSSPDTSFQIVANFIDENYAGWIKWDQDHICRFEKYIQVNEILPLGEKHFSETCPNIGLVNEHGEPVEQEGEVTINYTIISFAPASAP